VTEATLKAHAAQLEEEKRQADRQRATAQHRADDLQGIELTFKAKVGEHERLYGSITSADIARQLEAHVGEAVDRRKVVLPAPIRELGKSQVQVRLHPDVTLTVTVIVEAEA